MALFGNVVGGVFVVLFHLIVVTNIDNTLRPFLVPKSAHLNPALMLLAVFAGLRMFGFWGIVLGPVLMIVIVTTISVYLAVYKGAPMEALRSDDEDDEERETPFWKRLSPFGKKQPPSARDEPAPGPHEPVIPPAAP
jgi:predicted PurR-regulated permease PerM